MGRGSRKGGGKMITMIIASIYMLILISAICAVTYCIAEVCKEIKKNQRIERERSDFNYIASLIQVMRFLEEKRMIKETRTIENEIQKLIDENL